MKSKVKPLSTCELCEMVVRTGGVVEPIANAIISSVSVIHIQVGLMKLKFLLEWLETIHFINAYRDTVNVTVRHKAFDEPVS